jgi:hypothetical protein
MGVLHEIDICQLLRIPNRQCAQPDGIDQLEDRGVGSDPQRERQHCHRRKRGIQPQLPNPEAQIACNIHIALDAYTTATLE